MTKKKAASNDQLGFDLSAAEIIKDVPLSLDVESESTGFLEISGENEVTSDLIDYFFLQEEGEESSSYQTLIYDQLPKYVASNKGREDGTLSIVELSTKVKDPLNPSKTHVYKVEIKPVRMKVKERVGEDWVVVEKDFYPSKRESLVEDVLRKLASDPKKVRLLFSRDTNKYKLELQFSIYEVEKLLHENKRTMNSYEIKDALTILRQAPISITGPKGNRDMTDFPSILESLTFSKAKGEAEDNTTKCRVVFNSALTRQIVSGKIRLFNFTKALSLKSNIASWLYKRMSRNFTQAHATKDFNISMSTILGESGEKVWAQTHKNRARITTAIKELIDKDVLTSYKEKVSYTTGKRPSVADVTYYFLPSDTFIAQVFKAHERKKIVDIKIKDRD